MDELMAQRLLTCHIHDCQMGVKQKKVMAWQCGLENPSNAFNLWRKGSWYTVVILSQKPGKLTELMNLFLEKKQVIPPHSPSKDTTGQVKKGTNRSFDVSICILGKRGLGIVEGYPNQSLSDSTFTANGKNTSINMFRLQWWSGIQGADTVFSPILSILVLWTYPHPATVTTGIVKFAAVTGWGVKPLAGMPCPEKRPQHQFPSQTEMVKNKATNRSFDIQVV